MELLWPLLRRQGPLRRHWRQVTCAEQFLAIQISSKVKSRGAACNRVGGRLRKGCVLRMCARPWTHHRPQRVHMGVAPRREG